MQKELCRKLEEIKSLNPTSYESVNKVLRFIYKIVQNDYFERKISRIKLSDEAHRVSGSAEYQYEVELKNNLFKNYIESNNGIVNTLFEMAKDEDQRFFEYFINKVDVPLTMFENGISCNTECFMYVYNLYVMLKVYDTKHDFYIFKVVLDDVANLFIDKNVSVNADNSKKGLIDRILNNEFFPEIDLLRGLLIKTLTESNTNDEKDKKRLNSMFMFFNELIRDKRKYGKLGCIGYTIKPEIFRVVASDIALLVHKDLLPGCEVFYDPIILFGDRYKTLKEHMKKIGIKQREEVYSYFVGLCPGLFEDLSKDKDFFIDCVDMIFDSDTYYEFYRKLETLSKADEFYQKGEKEAAYKRINTLKTDCHRESLLGYVLSFDKESNNKIEKPKTIHERTKQLYLKHDLVPTSFNWEIFESSSFPLEAIKGRLNTEAFEYNASKQITLQEQAKPTDVEQPKQKKKSRFNIFG